MSWESTNKSPLIGPRWQREGVQNMLGDLILRWMRYNYLLFDHPLWKLLQVGSDHHFREQKGKNHRVSIHDFLQQEQGSLWTSTQTHCWLWKGDIIATLKLGQVLLFYFKNIPTNPLSFLNNRIAAKRLAPGPSRSSSRCGTDGLGQYKTNGMTHYVWHGLWNAC